MRFFVDAMFRRFTEKRPATIKVPYIPKTPCIIANGFCLTCGKEKSAPCPEAGVPIK